MATVTPKTFFDRRIRLSRARPRRNQVDQGVAMNSLLCDQFRSERSREQFCGRPSKQMQPFSLRVAPVGLVKHRDDHFRES
jgi:hypothetical protein